MIELKREGRAYRVEAKAFHAWARQGNLLATDQLRATTGAWRPATSFATLKQYLPASGFEAWLKLGAAVAAGVAIYKVGQAIFDEDFGTRHYPEWFRRQQIDEHVAAHGAFCPSCERRVRIADLTLDHIVPWAAGGLTSRQNARVICGSCNSSKQDRAGFLDYVRGRAG
jgi:hypothetical protein